MYIIYLKEEDLLKSEQFPVIALINEASNCNIIEFVDNLVNGIGICYNYSSCSFWNDFDEYEQSQMSHFDGLWVGNEVGEEVIISYCDMLYYLELLYSKLDINNFTKLNELRLLLNSFKDLYC